jgi:hypothetical protein
LLSIATWFILGSGPPPITKAFREGVSCTILGIAAEVTVVATTIAKTLHAGRFDFKARFFTRFIQPLTKQTPYSEFKK